MYLYDIKYNINNPKGCKKTNTVSKRGRTKHEAIVRFRATHPTDSILKTKRLFVLTMYSVDRFDNKFDKMRRYYNKYI